jgi:putative two-component system response regulator
LFIKIITGAQDLLISPKELFSERYEILEQVKMVYRGSVLVVDDELGPRESLRMILKPVYEVFFASNGTDALQSLRSHKIDLVTLDLRMPGISGIEVLKEIKKTSNDVEVIIVTGFGSLTNAVEAIRYGAVDFISKPFDVAEILSIANRSMERRIFNLRMKNLLQKIKTLHLPGPDGMEEALLNLEKSLGGSLPESHRGEKELLESVTPLDHYPFSKVAVNCLDFFKVLVYILESKEPYTFGHSERVSFYAETIAHDLNLSAEEKANLHLATLLHDIGKIGLSNRLLEKADLSEDENLDIRRHPIQGVHLIEPLSFPAAVTGAIRHHHERWDGKGYPDGLAGEEIPLLARIVSLADSYDAMTSDRPYRPELDFGNVQEEILKNSGIQFDPGMVSAFAKHFRNGAVRAPISPAPDSN